MRIASIIAIYALFWVMSAFLVLPFGVRTHREAGQALTPGQAESAPADFRPGRVIVRTTILSLILFGLFYANYVNQWVSADDVDFFRPPPEVTRAS